MQTVVSARTISKAMKAGKVSDFLSSWADFTGIKHIDFTQCVKCLGYNQM